MQGKLHRNRNKSALSTVMGMIIIAVVTISLAITSSYWVGGLTAAFTRFDKIEIKHAQVNYNGSHYVIVLYLINTGSTSTSIDSIMLNDVPYSDFSPPVYLGGNLSALPSPCETGVSKIGMVIFQDGAIDPSGNRLKAGVALTITLHTSSGKKYYTMVNL